MSLSRRDFSKAAALASAASLLPHSLRAAQAGDKKIGFCIVGLGRISMEHFMPGLLQAKHAKLTALVSGHPEKARQQAQKYGIPESSIYTYEQFDRIRDNPAIDAVYIALPNSMHAEYTIRAAKAGKHVLCEKPMSTTIADARAMIAACSTANKKLMIAYRCQLEPTTLKVRELLRSGAIGPVQVIESANGFNIHKGEWRLDKKLGGGGPLMDVGIYSLNAARFLTGEEPQVLSAYSSVIDHDGRFDSVEENLGWTMRFPSGIIASCTTTYGAQVEGFYRIHGPKGLLHMEPAFGYQGLHLAGYTIGPDGKHQPIDIVESEHDPEQFTAEGDYFADCVLNDKPIRMSGEEGLRDMEIMMQIYRSAGVPVETAPVYRTT